MAEVTELLHAAMRGDGEAERQLYAALYDDLHRMARARLRRNVPVTLLQTTTLVHEAYLRLHQSAVNSIADRNHFLAYAARVMRSIIVDLVRERQSARRGGELNHVPFDENVQKVPSPQSEEILRVHNALQELGRLSPRLAQIVEMRYFAGMSEAEIANALDLSERTVRRDWEKARMMLAGGLLQ